MVVAYHISLPGFSGGYIGVDVFFVLSGYLITGLLLREFDSTGHVDLVEFYARRVRRLLPAATVVLLATLCVARFLYAPFQQLGFAGTALATAAYVSNLWFAKEAVAYLAPSVTRNPFLHTWSLSVEEQFYLVWPLLLLMSMKYGRTHARRTRVVLVVSGVAVVSFCAGLWLTRTAQPLAFFVSPARAWEFAIGGIGALMAGNLAGMRQGTKTACLWFGLAALTWSAIRFDQTTVFPGVAVLLPVSGTALLVTIQAPSSSLVTRLLSNTLLRWFGSLSYSWYLWHWPVIVVGLRVFAGRIVGITSLEVTPWTDGLALRIGLATFALFLAWLTFHVVEHPVRSSKALAKRPRFSLALAASLTVVSIAASWTMRDAARHAADDPTQRSFSAAWLDIPRVYADGCHLGFFETAVKPCTFGTGAAAPAMVLFGDSHAAQWFPAIERIAQERGMRFVSFTKSACPAATVDRVDPQLGRVYFECDQWRRSAIHAIVGLHPHTVIMSSWSGYVEAGRKHLPGGVTMEAWRAGTQDTLREFSEAGVNTLLIRDTPRPGFDVLGCQAMSVWNPSFSARFSQPCSFERAASVSGAAFGAEQDAASRLSRVGILDLTEVMCGAMLCSPTYRGIPVYRDGDHVTATFAATQVPVLSKELDRAPD